MKQNTESIDVVATFAAKPGKEQELEKLFRHLVEATHKEAGCLLYSLHRSSLDPDSFFFVEKWASQKDLDAHLKSPHVASALQRKDELIQSMSIVPLQALGGGDPTKNSL